MVPAPPCSGQHNHLVQGDGSPSPQLGPSSANVAAQGFSARPLFPRGLGREEAIKEHGPPEESLIISRVKFEPLCPVLLPTPHHSTSTPPPRCSFQASLPP
jgi:hypothetical protein